MPVKCRKLTRGTKHPGRTALQCVILAFALPLRALQGELAFPVDPEGVSETGLSLNGKLTWQF